MSIGLPDLTQRLTNDGSVVIFLFHGVIERQVYNIRNYTRKHIEASSFIKLIEPLGRLGYPLSMDDVLNYCNRGLVFPKGAFAITFDDGFENNVSVARPILERIGIPATVYVTTRFVDENAMSWIDRIEFVFEKVSSGYINLPWSAQKIYFSNSLEKIELLRIIRKYVKNSPKLDINAFVSDIYRQLEQEEIYASNDPLDRKMSWDQVRSWSGGGFLIGGHSHSHPILSFLAPEQLEYEINMSVDLLKTKANLVCLHYSYPEGLLNCYSQEVISALKSRGVLCCPTAIDGVNHSNVDPFELKRVMVS